MPRGIRDIPRTRNLGPGPTCPAGTGIGRAAGVAGPAGADGPAGDGPGGLALRHIAQLTMSRFGKGAQSSSVAAMEPTGLMPMVLML